MPRSPRRRALRSTASLLLICAGAVAIAQVAGVTGGGAGQSGTMLVFEGTHARWLVQLPSTGSSPELGRAVARLGGGKSTSAPGGGWHEVRLGTEIAAAEAEAAFERAGATAIEPALPRLPYTSSPEAIDDAPGTFTEGTASRASRTAPRLGEQWALQQSSDQDIDGVEAWNRSTGRGSVVAVIDTGVDASHPDLVGRVLPGRNFSSTGGSATVDAIGHGTHVASIIAAGGGGILGVAPDASILPLRVFGTSPSSFSMSGYIAAIRYAADAGADVINISLGCGGTPSCFSQAELDALRYANERGVVVVAASGNGDRSGHGMDNDAAGTPDYPSGYDLPNIVSVTSSTRLGGWSTWANYGSDSVDLAAPGEGILAAATGGGYRTVTGTSFSAPHVAGGAALVAATSPDTSPGDVRAQLVASANPSVSLDDRTVSGGVLNAEAAAAGGPSVAASGGRPVLIAPTGGASVSSLPVLVWRLPAGWNSVRLRLRAAGTSFDTSLLARRQASVHPPIAWQAGRYRWQVEARTPSGQLVSSAWASYRIAPRLGAWASLGRLRDDGRSLTLRAAYLANDPRATTRITVRSGGRVLHHGVPITRTAHVRRAGPRRAWFSYSARLASQLRVGQRVTIDVEVRAAGRTLKRSFSARVA